MLGHDLVRNDLRGQRNPPLVRSDRGRTENANHDVERARGEKEKGERAMSKLCSSERPDFPLADL